MLNNIIFDQYCQVLFALINKIRYLFEQIKFPTLSDLSCLTKFQMLYRVNIIIKLINE